MLASTLCYLKRDGQTLMLHRIKKDKDVHQGKYNGLGGKFHAGETPEDCVIREVKEESGLEITRPRLRGVMTFPEFKDQEDWLVFLFTAEDFSGEMRECEEGVLGWIDDNELPNLHLWEGDRYFLEWLQKDKFFSARFCYKEGKLIDHAVTFYEFGGMA
ncbi:MAG: 8-oxo-dGTP diphosphatase [Candidatus Omnitrophica bacterium]|nr:8-oxo-dGTP diphosphatase [Candidatus Omnitrophota bacterium]